MSVYLSLCLCQPVVFVVIIHCRRMHVTCIVTNYLLCVLLLPTSTESPPSSFSSIINCQQPLLLMREIQWTNEYLITYLFAAVKSHLVYAKAHAMRSVNVRVALSRWRRSTTPMAHPHQREKTVSRLGERA